MHTSHSVITHKGLDWLVEQLDSVPGIPDAKTIHRLLKEAQITWEEVKPYVAQQPEGYNRQVVVRRDSYELLVLTWGALQGSVAHDHSGCVCGMTVVRGRATENLFEETPDGEVRPKSESVLGTQSITVDPGVIVHALRNESTTDTPLVTVHVYAPPLSELRKYAISERNPPRVFQRKADPGAHTIAIVGAGFSGAMTLANIFRHAGPEPLRILIFDRQAALGEGAAYRTNDANHLLNVPAGKMSAWTDRPDDFVRFAQNADTSIAPSDFLPRRFYGQYIRETVRDAAERAGLNISATVVRDEVARLTPKGSQWEIETERGRRETADITVLAVGHRPPDCSFLGPWAGPRNRFVSDPWAAMILGHIGANDPVFLIGTGLTAIDVILTLNRKRRTAPIIALSRHGLMPQSHLEGPHSPADLSAVLTGLLECPNLSVRQALARIRREIETRQSDGFEWQQIMDALRPAVQKLWQNLSTTERARFLRHVRPFWEVHRHRTAPQIARTIHKLKQDGALEIIAGSVLAAKADQSTIDVTFSRRGNRKPETRRVAWLVNCTGPGAHNRHSTHPFLRPLLDNGTLMNDPFGLGLLSDPDGRAMDAHGNVLSNLVITGTLRKATLWESTAVPELRVQAQSAAQTALAELAGLEPVHALVAGD